MYAHPGIFPEFRLYRHFMAQLAGQASGQVQAHPGGLAEGPAIVTGKSPLKNPFDIFRLDTNPVVGNDQPLPLHISLSLNPD